MSLAFFAFGRGLGRSLRRSSGLRVLGARCTDVPSVNAAATSHIGQRRAWCAQASTWCNAFMLLDAGGCCNRRLLLGDEARLDGCWSSSSSQLAIQAADAVCRGCAATGLQCCFCSHWSASSSRSCCALSTT